MCKPLATEFFPLTVIPVGGGGSALTIALTNGGGSTAKAGSALYLSGANTFLLAVASGLAISGVVAIAGVNILSGGTDSVVLSGVLALTTAQWDAIVTGQVGGLTPGALYFLDAATPGNLTATAPTTPGQVVTLIGRAISSTQLFVTIEPPILL